MTTKIKSPIEGSSQRAHAGLGVSTSPAPIPFRAELVEPIAIALNLIEWRPETARMKQAE
jgi:hypothetical protein